MYELDNRPPSQVEAALPPDAPTLAITSTLQRIQGSDLPIRNVRPAAVPTIDGAVWEAELEWLLADDQVLEMRVYTRATEQEMFGFHVGIGQLSEEVAEAVKQCRYGVGVSTLLGDPPVVAYHAQLQLLCLLAPEAAGVLDIGAATARPPDWLWEVAGSAVPPHPENLFAIHAVHDADENLWLHTHGLHRCGSIEIDMVGVKQEHAWALHRLMNAVAKRFMDLGYPADDEPFEPGRDLELVCMRLPGGMSHLSDAKVGGWDDRDEVHLDERGVLLVRQPGRVWGHTYVPPSVLVPLLEDNPLLYVSTQETTRATALAIERFDRFKVLFDSIGEHPAFQFLVKLSFQMEGAPVDEREHIWFTLHGIQGDALEATCMNEPFYVPDLAAGQRGQHSVQRLSDWCILSPLGQSGPDAVRQIEEVATRPEVLDQFRELIAQQEP